MKPKQSKKTNNLTRRLLSLTLSIVMILTMWGGTDLNTAYADTVSPETPFTEFSLNTAGTVKANWNQSDQKLSIIGTGKIEKDKWKELAQKFHKYNATNEKTWLGNSDFTIEFVDKTIQFPDDTIVVPPQGYSSSYRQPGGFFTYFAGEIILNKNMDVSNVTNMSFMFAETQTANPDVSKWDVSNVINMNYMFANTQTANPDVSKWKAPKLKNILFMFRNAQAVQKIDLSNIEATSIDAEYAFLDTPNLEELKIAGLENVKLNSFAGKYIIYNIDKDTKTKVDDPKTEQMLDDNTNYHIYLQSAPPIITTHTVKFDTDGGSLIPSVKVVDGKKVVKPKDPTKKGYTFDKWQLSGTDYDFTTPVTADITLKAVWTKKETTPETSFTTFDLNTGGTVKANWSQSEQKLSITGTGKIEKDKWKELAQKFDKENAGENHMWRNNSDFTIEFVDDTVQFPNETVLRDNYNNSIGFFQNFAGEIILNQDMDVSNVTNMSYMFANTQTANPDVSKWKAPKLKNILFMFDKAQAVQKIDLSNIGATNIYAQYAFSDIPNLEELKISGLKYVELNSFADRYIIYNI